MKTFDQQSRFAVVTRMQKSFLNDTSSLVSSSLRISIVIVQIYRCDDQRFYYVLEIALLSHTLSELSLIPNMFVL